MRTVFLLDRKGDKDEHILKTLKTFLQFSAMGMQLKTGFEALKKQNRR